MKKNSKATKKKSTVTKKTNKITNLKGKVTRLHIVLPVLILAVAAVAWTAMTPSALTLAPPSAGSDPALAQAVQTQFGSKYKNLSVAKIDATTGTIKYANFGATNTTEYEIGSVSKTFVGLLMADSISRGEVTENSTVASLLPIATNRQSAQLTLAELASHRSGLPSLPSTLDMQWQVLRYQLFGTNLVPFSLNQLLSQTRVTSVKDRGVYKYSNMAVALEGHMLASAAHTNYKTLLQNRLLTPLGMTNTRILAAPSDVTAATTRGTNANGRVMQPYAGEGYAPPATARSTIGDMAGYVLKVMKNQAPGMSALTPRWSAASGQRVGYNWFTDSKNRSWHNGLTGGFASMMMFDKATGKGIVVLSNTAVIVDNGAIALLENPAI